MSGIMSMLLGAVSSAAAAVDEFFNRVTLLLPGNGTNGAQNNTFLDSSSNNFTITRNGNTTQGSFTPFSQTGWSNYFDGTDDYLAVADNVVLRPGTSNFTLEAWIWRNASGAAHTIYAKGGASTGIVFQVTSTNVLRFTHTTTNIDSTGTIAANTWTHVAVVREGTGTNQTKLYINGSQDGQGTVSTDFTQTEEVRIGTDRGATADFNGYISNLRFVKGTALYTTTFTPSTTPLTTTSQGATATEVELLTCQSNRFIDNSTNAFALTLSGTPSVQAFSPFLPTAAYSAATVGGSGYFDGTGDYLSIPYNSALVFDSGNFTVECWFYLTGNAGLNGSSERKAEFASCIVGIPTTAGWEFLLNGDSTKTGTGILFTNRINSSTAYTITATVTVNQNQWNHVAVVRSGTTTTIYLNGLSVGSGTLTNQSITSANSLWIGRQDVNNFTHDFPGYISNFRIVKGTAVYTTGFTPPTAPLTNITNTQLLCNFTNAGITDATAKNDLETVGNAQISTTQSKFGGSSMYFDGTGDYLKAPGIRPLYEFYTGDFTVEAWVRFNSISATYQTLAGIWLASDKYGWIVQMRSTDVLFGYGSVPGASPLSVTFSWTPSTNTWYHLAITRAGSSVRAFIDGTQIGSTQTISASIQSSTQLLVGANEDGGPSGYFNGYIDDLRISKYARYTANFTAPTSALPLQ